MTTDEMTFNQMWDKLLDMGVCEQTLITVTKLNGNRKDVLLDILFCLFGYRNFEQMEDE